MEINKNDIHPKLIESIIGLISGNKLSYYGEFLLFINFIKTNIGTCGVNVTKQGMNYYWDEEFINKQTDKSVNFLNIHEIMHLLFEHIRRTVGYDKKLSNIAQDMIINQIIFDDIIMNIKTSNLLEIPKDEYGKNIGVFIPKEYIGDHIFEDLYQWLKDKQDKWKDDGCSITKPKYGNYGKSHVDMSSIESIFENLEKSDGCSLDKHLEDEIPEEMKKEIIENAIEKLRSRGFETNNITSNLEKLRKSEKDYLKDIKRSVTNNLFGNLKSRTITIPNRRQIAGLKGFKKYQSRINCILDTSASMTGLHEKVLSYIFSNNIIINLISIDTEIKDYRVIKTKNELKKLELKGFGGTNFSNAITFIKEKLNNYNTLILTDGMTNSLDFSGIKGNVLIISLSQKAPICKSNGRIKQILIEKN